MTTKINRVSFLIAGVQKGGTTILDNYLRSHPDVCMANKKEVHFFDNEKIFHNNNRKIDYEQYHSQFTKKNRHKVIGESTPIYTYWKPAAKRIFEYNKDMKFIILLRNPIERAYSQWNKETNNFHSYAHKQLEAVESLPFYEAIIQEESRCAEALPLQHRYYSYIDRGMYSKQLNRILKYFPRNQLLVLKSDWLKLNTVETMSKIYYFLNVNNHSLPEFNMKTPEISDDTVSPVNFPQKTPFNTGSYARPISEREYNYLANCFEMEIRQLEELLGWDCSSWL